MTFLVPELLPNYDNIVEIFGNWTWILAGLMVGTGTKVSPSFHLLSRHAEFIKYSNGCTSGHLLCGVFLGSLRSIIAATTFCSAAVITATIAFWNFPSPCGDIPCYTPTYPSDSKLQTLLSILATTYIISLTTGFLPASQFSRTLVCIWSGFLFGLGLITTGMANPSKPLGFLLMIPDGGQRWDPSLGLVIVFAGLPNFLLWRSYLKKPTPRLDTEWHLSTRKEIDFRLLAGSGLFGVGWGILGVCPGAGIPGGFLGGWKGVVWLAAFVAGNRFF